MLLSVPVCWPVSIAREFADTLNFVRAMRNRGFDNACKYGSNEKSDLKLLYVVSLYVTLIYEVFIRLKDMKIVAEIFVIPRNMSFAVLRSSPLIHIMLSDDIYSRTFYRYSLFKMD